MNYPGGKGADGVFQTIINQIPPHQLYIEGFLGGGAILRKKLPAEINIGIDLDPELIEIWRENPEYRFQRADQKSFYFFCQDFIGAMTKRNILNHAPPDQTFIYLDPPYLPEARKTNGSLYKFEMDHSDHVKLLQFIKTRKEMIMISGYKSNLYSELLSTWRSISFLSMTRGGSPAREFIWMNYPQPNRLHDFRFLGENFTDRQRIKRKAQRFRNKILSLPPLERAAILHAIDDIKNYDEK